MVDLTPYNTLRVPAHAQSLIEIDTLSNIKKISSDSPFILGSGANVLFTKDFPGQIVLIKIPGRKIIKETNQDVIIEFGAGENWDEVVRWTVANNWSGMENMVDIPGTIGAAPAGNIAAYGQNQEDIFVKLRAINLKTHKSEVFTKKDMQFAYRESIFKSQKLNYLITSVTYKLSKIAHLELSYHAARHASLLPQLQKFAKEPYTILDVAQAVSNLRAAKLPSIKNLGTAGSFFKNPVVKKEIFLSLKNKYPDLQSYPPEKLSYIDDLSNYVKIPAGMLLDNLGWRGKRVGNVGVFPTHALLVCNYGGATGQEVFEFSESMRSDVQKNFNIDLEYEIIVI